MIPWHRRLFKWCIINNISLHLINRKAIKKSNKIITASPKGLILDISASWMDWWTLCCGGLCTPAGPPPLLLVTLGNSGRAAVGAPSPPPVYTVPGFIDFFYLLTVAAKMAGVLKSQAVKSCGGKGGGEL